mmetsp:Transcript_26551/g.57649  ORF Transcript_26551/g.57649 Transcript_26551/m.57649 type:complete len:309 (-) Transcript_26551:810-1736(-)
MLSCWEFLTSSWLYHLSIGPGSPRDEYIRTNSTLKLKAWGYSAMPISAKVMASNMYGRPADPDVCLSRSIKVTIAKSINSSDGSAASPLLSESRRLTSVTSSAESLDPRSRALRRRASSLESSAFDLSSSADGFDLAATNKSSRWESGMIERKGLRSKKAWGFPANCFRKSLTSSTKAVNSESSIDERQASLGSVLEAPAVAACRKASSAAANAARRSSKLAKCWTRCVTPVLDPCSAFLDCRYLNMRAALLTGSRLRKLDSSSVGHTAGASPASVNRATWSTTSTSPIRRRFKAGGSGLWKASRMNS